MSRLLLMVCLVSSIGLADTLALRNGSTVRGTYLGGSARQVKMAVGDQVQSYDISDVTSISFSHERDSTAAPPPPPPDGPRSTYNAPPPSAPAPAPTSPVAPPPPVGPQLPAGTRLTIRMIDDVDSQRDHVGQTYRASMAEAVQGPDGQTLIPRGADVVAKLVADEQSGKIEGRTVLTLDLQSLTIDGRSIDINTENVSQSSSSRGARSAKVIGGTAVLGAIIGAVAGGGKGAGIGTLAGAGAGTVAEVATKGQRVRIPSETRLTFTLQNPVQL